MRHWVWVENLKIDGFAFLPADLGNRIAQLLVMRHYTLD
jgi:hypothetical protein